MWLCYSVSCGPCWLFVHRIWCWQGIFALWSPDVRALLDLKAFVDTDSDIRLARRLTRDIMCRGRTVETVLHQYRKTVKPGFDFHVYPTKNHADVIIPWNESNSMAVLMFVQFLALQLQYRGNTPAAVPMGQRAALPTGTD